MEVFSKKNRTMFFLPKTDFQALYSSNRRPVFLERDLMDFSTYSAFDRHKICRRYDTFQYLSKRRIMQQIICDHVVGGVDPAVM